MTDKTQRGKTCAECGTEGPWCFNCEPSAASAGYAINCTLPENWNKILWCIYGPDCFPTMFCCKIIAHPTCGPTVWGYSVYEGEPGFRTLGQGLAKWATSMRELYEQDVVFYDNQEAALRVLRQLTTPKA